jgi:beta-phosphoglucomutase family hydrolase
VAERPDPTAFDAVLYDLDGVLTDTASLHATAWKAMFDEFLQRWAEVHDHPFVPFRIDPDYFQWVDGKPRLQGVSSFLESRRIVLPDGDPDDPSDADTIHGLATRKNELFNQLVEDGGVEVFPGSIRFVEAMETAGLRAGIVSSSRNAGRVLRVVELDDHFDVRVDGVVAAELGLEGKPAPDTFLEGARRLDVAPERAIVVEDASAGVEAGRLGGFGLVIGINRSGDAERLHEAGADVVVDDLAELLDE